MSIIDSLKSLVGIKAEAPVVEAAPKVVVTPEPVVEAPVVEVAPVVEAVPEAMVCEPEVKSDDTIMGDNQ